MFLLFFYLPDPSSRAVADSFLNSFWAEPAASFSTTAGAIGAKLGCDDDSAALLWMLGIASEKR